MSTIERMNEYLQDIVASYLTAGDLCCLIQTSKLCATTFLPYLYQRVTSNAMQTIADATSLTSLLCRYHPASYVRHLTLDGGTGPTHNQRTQTGLTIIDRMVRLPNLRSFAFYSTSLTLADVFKGSPSRLRPVKLLLACPMLDINSRKTLSIVRSLVTPNIRSLTLKFPAFAPQPAEYTLNKMIMQVLPSLTSLVELKILLATRSTDVVNWKTDGTPRRKTLADLFHGKYMDLPALRLFSLKEMSYHIHIDRFLERHPLLLSLHVECGGFDHFPLPDWRSVRTLPSLTHFKGSLANVNYLLAHCQTSINSLTIVSGPGSCHAFDTFSTLIEANPNIRKMELQENGGYIGHVMSQYLTTCTNVETLAVDFGCSVTVVDEGIESKVFEGALRDVILHHKLNGTLSNFDLEIVTHISKKIICGAIF
ncbi:hypothetical protein EV368DRAFT_81879 [Lentinula lateritia]|nr:hypothetical protein EV368DRAFT_81879 [Lentinula lateritia]